MTQRIPLAEHVADARALLDAVRGRGPVAVDAAALGRIAAEPVRARIDVPGVDNSQMDGFALRAADLRGTATLTLPLGAPIAAGDAPSALDPGTARAIMTGAPLPAGADLVVPVEESARGTFTAEPAAGTADADPEDWTADPGTVTLTPASAEPGRYVRRRGSDTRAGDTVLREGQALTAARIAHLASCGVREIEAWEPLRVVVCSTGSEVGADALDAPSPDAPCPEESGAPARATIGDANGPGLAAALSEAGAVVLATAVVPDDAQTLLTTLRELAAVHDADLIVTSGGVSQGAYEVVRQAAAHEGVTLAFPTLAIQPGGPQGIGSLALDDRPVPWMALPGNPVSALLGAELILRPALGAPPRPRLRLPLQLEAPEPSPAHLDQYRRAYLLPSGRVRLAGGPSSHLLGALAGADALVLVPRGVGAVHDGDELETLLLPGGGR